MITVLFINNDGGGFAERIELEDGTTAGQLYDRQMPDTDEESFSIKVNNRHVARETPLADGDRVSVTPVKVDGA